MKNDNIKKILQQLYNNTGLNFDLKKGLNNRANHENFYSLRLFQKLD